MALYSTLFAFGDSLSDAGNTYRLSISKEATVLGFSPTPVSPPYAQIRVCRETNESSWPEERRNRIANALGATRGRKAILDG